MIQGAIFDADGTLIDSMPVWEDLGARYLLSRGIIPEEGLNERLFPLSMEESAAFLKARYDLAEEPDVIRRGFVRILEDFYRREVPLKPGAAQFLDSLHRAGIPMVIATAGDELLLSCALRRLGVLHFFTDILTCSSLSTDKHSPLIYETAARKIASPPGKTVVFEDVLYALNAARDAGCIPVAVEDAAGISARAEIRAAARYVMPDFTDSDAFFSFAKRL